MNQKRAWLLFLVPWMIILAVPRLRGPALLQTVGAPWPTLDYPWTKWFRAPPDVWFQNEGEIVEARFIDTPDEAIAWGSFQRLSLLSDQSPQCADIAAQALLRGFRQWNDERTFDEWGHHTRDCKTCSNCEKPILLPRLLVLARRGQKFWSWLYLALGLATLPLRV